MDFHRVHGARLDAFAFTDNLVEQAGFRLHNAVFLFLGGEHVGAALDHLFTDGLGALLQEAADNLLELHIVDFDALAGILQALDDLVAAERTEIVLLELHAERITEQVADGVDVCLSDDGRLLAVRGLFVAGGQHQAPQGADNCNDENLFHIHIILTFLSRRKYSKSSKKFSETAGIPFFFPNLVV